LPWPPGVALARRSSPTRDVLCIPQDRGSFRVEKDVADLYVLAHRDYGPITTFVSREAAEEELERVFGDEPTWVGTLTVEPFELVVEDAG
jgi:hypothetical protein